MKKLAILSLAVLSLAGTANALTITFDELGAQPGNFASTTALRNQYAGSGVQFWGNDGPTGINGGAILDESSNFGTSAFSGKNFLAFNNGAGLSGGGTPNGPETIKFAGTVSSVSAMVAEAFQIGSFTFDAYNSANTLIASTTIRTQNWDLLKVTAAGISYVKFSYSTPDGFAIMDDLTTDVVPEPVSILALGAGLLAVARRRRN